MGFMGVMEEAYMDANGLEQMNWSDAYCVAEPEPTITYRAALVVYEEALIKERFVGLGWNGAGFVNFYDGRLDPAQHPTPQAFWLEMDGQLLASDWEWVGFERVVDSVRSEASPRAYRSFALKAQGFSRGMKKRWPKAN
jgi:hypothetical protein